MGGVPVGWKYYSSFAAALLLSFSNAIAVALWYVFLAESELNPDFLYLNCTFTFHFSFAVLFFLAVPLDAILRSYNKRKLRHYALAGLLINLPLIFWPRFIALVVFSTLTAALFFKFFVLERHFLKSAFMLSAHSAYSGFFVYLGFTSLADD